MRVCTLASSSKGNSILVYSENTKILVDAGLNIDILEEKLNLLNLRLGDVNAILITHEHTDHIKGLPAIIRKYKIKTYAHKLAVPSIIKKLGKKADPNLIIPIFFEPFDIGEFTVKAFSLPHDSVMCVGYNIIKDNKKISIATDFGHTNSSIIENLYNSRLVILESNHDITRLLANVKYSALLKSRILSDNGHLSNMAAAKTVCELAKNNVKQILLAHLSEENNTKEICLNTINTCLNEANIKINEDIFVDVASPYEISKVYHLN